MVKRLALAALLGASGCGLMARGHPCWGFVSHQLKGQVPDTIVSELAHDRGAEKVVKGNRAPIGYYWRRLDKPNPDIRHMQQYIGGHELTACPAGSMTRGADPKTKAARQPTDGTTTP